MLHDFTPFHRVFFVRTRSWDGLVELAHNREEVEVGDQILLGANRFDAQRYEVLETRSGIDQLGLYCADLRRIDPEIWIAGKPYNRSPSARPSIACR